MRRQLVGTLLLLLLLLLLQLAPASETSGQDDLQMGQSTSPRTSYNSILQTRNTRVTKGMTTVLTEASTVITTTDTVTYMRTPTDGTQEGRVTATSPLTAVTTTRQDMASSTTTSKSHGGTAAPSAPMQPTEATLPETKVALGTSTLVSTEGEDTDSSTTKMALDAANGTITASTAVTEPTATVSSLLKRPEGTFPIASSASTSAASTAKAADPVPVTPSETPGGILPYSVWTNTHAGTSGPVKTILSKTSPIFVPLTTLTTAGISTTKKHSRPETTNAAPLITMIVTEALKGTADMTTSNAETVLMTASEAKTLTTVPATADSMKDMNFSVSTMSSKPKNQGGATAQAPAGSIKLMASAGHTVPPMRTTTLPTAPSTRSSGTKPSPIMLVPNSSVPTMSKVCASDEYPSTNLEQGCICNSSYYAHSEVNNVTVALSCRPWEMEVSLSQCFLEARGWVQGSALFPGCSGISQIVHDWRAITFVVKRNESTCGLRLSTNTSHALYSLNIQLPPVSHGSKLFNDSNNFSVSCDYPLVANVSQKGPPKVATSRHININDTGSGDSIITLSIFTDAQYSSLLVDQPVAFYSPLYVAIEATHADPERFVLVANAFFASTNASGASAPETTYYFVKYSCPVSERLLTQPSTNEGSLKVKLAFHAFRFFTSNIMYYHSHVTLCDKQGNSSCQPTCTKMSQKQKNLVELEQRNKDRSGWLTYGPIQFQGSDPSHNGAPAGSMKIWLAFLFLVAIS